MTVKTANTLSFNRLSFAAEETPLHSGIRDKVPFETPTSTFRRYVDTRYSTSLSDHENLHAQILLAQIAQESDE